MSRNQLQLFLRNTAKEGQRKTLGPSVRWDDAAEYHPLYNFIYSSQQDRQTKSAVTVTGAALFSIQFGSV
jgi:hypothetical protein